MNHAERVKDLVLTIFEDGFSVRHGPNSSDKDAAFAAIDAMQSALDDAVAKLAERDAEVERFRKLVQRVAKYPENAACNGTLIHDDILLAAGPKESWDV